MSLVGFLLDGDNYFALQEFFEDRTVPDYQMMSREYVHDIGLPFYDLRRLLKWCILGKVQIITG